MQTPLKKIRSLIPALPPKDAKLAEKFLENRNFEGILELTNANLIKLYTKNNMEEVNDKEDRLIDLQAELRYYMSFSDIPETNNIYYDDV